MSAPFAPDPVPEGSGAASAVSPAPNSPAQLDAAAWAAAQRQLTELGLIDLRARWEQQPDLHPIVVGAGQQADTTIAGFPEDAFHGIAILNPTVHTLRVGFGTSSATGAPIVVPPKSLLVWPAEYANVTINTDTALPAETVAVLRLRYPPPAPTLEALPGNEQRETWSEEESAQAGAIALKVPGKAGRKIVVTSVNATVVNTGAVAAAAVLELTIKSGGNTIFKVPLLQAESAGVGGYSNYTSGPINLTLKEGEGLEIAVTAGAANVKTAVNASGYFQ